MVVQTTGIENILQAIQTWQASLFILLLSIVGALITERVGLYAVKRFFEYSSLKVDTDTIDTFRAPLYTTAVFIGLSAALRPFGLSSLVNTNFDSILVTIGAAVWLRSLLEVGDGVIENVAASRIDKEIAPIAENIWDVLSVALVFIIVIRSWGFNITPFLASAGLIGVAVGFAAKDTIANLFGSLALYADKTYQKGQYIVLKDGSEGTVKDVSIRSTTLVTRDGDRVTIPNSKLNEATVRNESEPSPSRRLRLPIGVSYDSEPEHVKDALLHAADDEPNVVDTPKPRVRFQKFGDSALQFELHLWIRNPNDIIEVRDNVNMSMYRILEEEGIEVPFPQRNLHFDSDTSDYELTNGREESKQDS